MTSTITSSDNLTLNRWESDLNQMDQQLPPECAAWLTNPESLTKRLRKLTDNKIEHQLLFNDWGKPDPRILTQLSIQKDEKTWIRQMNWCSNTEQWIHGIVVIPEFGITKQTEELLRIGKNSIGDTLFTDNNLERFPFYFQYDGVNNTWSRLRILHYKSTPMAILETFFPAFFEHLSQ